MYPASNPASLITTPKPIKHRNQEPRVSNFLVAVRLCILRFANGTGVSYSSNVHQTHTYTCTYTRSRAPPASEREKDDGGGNTTVG